MNYATSHFFQKSSYTTFKINNQFNRISRDFSNAKVLNDDINNIRFVAQKIHNNHIDIGFKNKSEHPVLTNSCKVRKP